MHCKTLGLVLVAAFVWIPQSQAVGIGSGGIPVHCENCAVATQNAAISIGEQIQAGTKIIEEAIGYHLKAQELNGAQRDAALENTRAAIEEDKKLGVQSLPRDACSVYAATGVRRQADASAAEVRDDLAESTVSHSRQSRDLPTGEPRKAYSVDRIIEELEEPTGVEAGRDARPLAVQVVSNDPIKPEEVERIKRLTNLFLIPFPVATPSEEQIDLIKAHGTPQQKEQLAASLALQRRQEAAAFSMDQLMQANIQNLDATEIKEFLEQRTGMPSPFVDGKLISQNQLSEHLHTYRVKSPEWYIDVASAEDDITLLRDQSMMMAEQLATLWDIRQLLVIQAKQASLESTREISQAGLTPR